MDCIFNDIVKFLQADLDTCDPGIDWTYCSIRIFANMSTIKIFDKITELDHIYTPRL